MTTPNQSHEHFEVGNIVVLQATYTDRDNDPASPNDVACRVLDPDGEITECSATETAASSGIFEALFTTIIPGKHWYTFEADGPVSSERAFQVMEDKIPVGS